MNNLLFTCLIIALIYYFFFYLPSQKKLKTNPILTHQFTQTDPILIENKELADLKVKHQALIKENKDYQTRSKDKDLQITNLQSQIRELAKRPLKPTNSKSTQTDNKDLENTLDTLIKNIQDLNNSL